MTMSRILLTLAAVLERSHDCRTTTRRLTVLFDRMSFSHGVRHKHLSNVVVRRFAAPLLCAVLFLAAACASAGNSSSSSKNDALITIDEIESSHQPTLFDVVRALRPHWLTTTPTGLRSDADAGISVYLDAQRAGGVDVLRQLPSTSASALRFYSASEAQSRFGLGNLHGVIQIVSPRGSR